MWVNVSVPEILYKHDPFGIRYADIVSSLVPTVTEVFVSLIPSAIVRIRPNMEQLLTVCCIP